MLPHLQFAIIDILGANERPGHEIREELGRKYRTAKTLAAFYMLMKRMEDANLIKGRYEVVKAGPYTAKERHYKVLGSGFRAWRTTRDWYINAAGALGRKQTPAGLPAKPHRAVT